VAIPSGITYPNDRDDGYRGKEVDTDTTHITPPLADLSITKTDGLSSTRPGNVINYTIVVSNAGPNGVTTTVTDYFPSQLTGITWSSQASGGAGGNDSGTGNINDGGVTLPSGGSVTYSVTATVSLTAHGTICNTASVAIPAGFADPNDKDDGVKGKEVDTDTTTITPLQADLVIFKTDNQQSALPGNSIIYTITVSNNGPDTVTNTTVKDYFPSSLNGISWTSVANGPASGNQTTGTGNINDGGITLGSGGSITYSVTATISSSARGTLCNTASVDIPSNVVDPNDKADGCKGQEVHTDTTNLVSTGSSTIKGVQFQDSNRNGTKESAEGVLAGWFVQLWRDNGDGKFGAGDTLLSVQCTNGSGQYSFANLGSGTYWVRGEKKAGWTTTSSDCVKLVVASNKNYSQNFACIL
jgi:uncharacterized repeat protein (TIGR01451 family)